LPVPRVEVVPQKIGGEVGAFPQRARIGRCKHGAEVLRFAQDHNLKRTKFGETILVLVLVGFDQLRHFGVGADGLDEHDVA